MKKKKDSLFVVIITLVISVIGLGIAYATFSTTLKINGSATVNASSWDIHFSSTSGGAAGGTVTPSLSNEEGFPTTATASVGTFNATQLTWNGSVKTQGDTITFDFFIVNAGDYDAKLSTLTKSALTCKVNSVPETDVCSKLSYIFRYKDGAVISQNDTLAAGQSKEVELILQLGNISDPTITIPNDNIVVDSDTLTITMLYTQN